MVKKLQEQKFNSLEIREKFKELFENSLDLIYVHDLRGNFMDANDITLLSLGYNRDELNKISFKDLIDERQLSTVFDALKEIKENGKQLKSSEYRLKTKNGDLLYVETYGIPLKKNGKVYGILGVAKDVTAGIETFQKLEDSERKLKELNIELVQTVKERTIKLKESGYKLRERVKELSCLYELSKLAENQDFTDSDIIQGALKLIPKAWQFPEITCVRIKLGDQESKTDNFQETKWGLKSDIKVMGELKGSLEIYYLKEKPDIDEGPFMKEERTLIDTLTRRLGKIAERMESEQKLKESEENLKILNEDLERKIYERTKKLSASEDRLIYAQRIARLGFWDLNIITGELYWSDETYRTFGFKPQEFVAIYEKFRSVVHPDDLEFVQKHVDAVLQEDIKYNIDFRIVKPSGEICYVDAQGEVSRDSNGKAIRFVGTQIDITERKKAEKKLKVSEEKYRSLSNELEQRIFERTKELKESEEKYRGIIENIKQGYFEVDLKGNFTFFNDELIEILGSDSDELMGMNHINYVDEETAKEIFKVYNNVFKANSGQNTLEFEIIKKNREKVFVETSVYLKKDAEGHRIGFYGLVRDITEKKKEEKHRESFKEQLEKEVNIRTKELNNALEQQKLYLDQIIRASQFKTEFLATMSHELRTPLNAIIGFTDLLLEGAYGPLNEEQMDFLNDIKSSAEHQLDMIKNILDISKIESGQLHLNWQRFSLNIIIDQAKSTVKPLYNKKGLNILVQGLDYEKFIYADPIRFKEILLNLLGNAIKFSMSGTITLIVQENARNWIIKVKDTGIGIARKDFDIIFKEFKRVDSPFVASVPGTGLGLSLTKRLVDLHGGEITFSSNLGKGTTFEFTIPKNKDKK